jgi:glyoxylase-like metal-dependent hydrolase (beta-lactamase superfamily II)
MKENTTMKVSDNIFVVPGVVANAYLLVDPDGLTIIDTGLPHSERKILAYVSGLGKSARDVKRILITHADIDHVGSLAALHKASGARTYASQVEAAAIAAGKSSREIRPAGFSPQRLFFSLMRPFITTQPFQVEEIVVDGQVLPALGGLRVLDTCGHTPGHISLFAPVPGALFCGDSMVTDESGIHGSRSGLTWDDAKAKAAVSAQASPVAQADTRLSYRKSGNSQ